MYFVMDHVSHVGVLSPLNIEYLNNKNNVEKLLTGFLDLFSYILALND